MAWNTITTATAASPWGATQANGVGLDLRTWGGAVDGGGYALNNLGDTYLAAGKKLGVGTATPGAACDVAGMIRCTGATTPASGEGFEMNYSSHVAYFTAIDRATVTYKPIRINGSAILLKPDSGFLPVYANNAAAVAGGLAAGSLYRTGGDPDAVCAVH